MARPTKEDARLMVQCATWFTASGVGEAMNWLRSPEFTDDYAAFAAKYPSGSQGRLHLMNVLGFYETIGTLWKQKLIDEGLLFDWLWVPAAWDVVQNVARGMRAEAKNAGLWENFEAMAERERAVASKAAAKKAPATRKPAARATRAKKAPATRARSTRTR
jgi:hypothetical protein